MIKLRIDNREVDVDPEQTILEAAQKLDIPIPTMCHMPEFHNNTSCMICTVQSGDNMLPACSTRVAEGMEIETTSSAVVEFRKTTLELLFSEHVGECVAPCELACPAHMQIPLMMKQIENDELDEAIITIKEDIALPAVLGYICSAPCENSCRRKFVDDSASICMLKRSAALDDLARDKSYSPPQKPASGKTVALIGAGPTGLAAAYYAQLSGHDCTIIDTNPEPGGLLRYAIDDETLPKDVLADEIQMIASTGVKFIQNKSVGQDISFDEIQAEYDAVVISIGKLENFETVFPGLTTDSRGVKVNQRTFETALPGVFAGGDCVRPRQMAIRSVADGKSIAGSIDRFFRAGSATETKQRVRSKLGKVELFEISEFLETAAPEGENYRQPREKLLDKQQEHDLASVCLQCGCRSADSCELRSLGDRYSADLQNYQYSSRNPVIKINSHPWVIYEPGKCIKCGLCVKITRARGENLGLTFIGRGFDVKVGVPYNETLEAGLKTTAQECVDACPTGAIGMKQNVKPFTELKDKV